MFARSLLNISLLSLAFSVSGCSPEHTTAPNAAVSLFDGSSLAGWEGDFSWFRVDNGSVVAGSLDKEIPHNLFLCTTKEYGDFELRLDAKLVGPRANSGIMLRSRRVPGETEVSGYQADIGGPIGDFGVAWGSLYDESRRNRMLVTANQDDILKAHRPDDWNEMVVRCHNSHVQVWVNGYQSVDYTEDDDSIERTGLIGLQIHKGEAAEAWFRNITLTEL